MPFQVCLQLLHTISINIYRSLGNPTKQRLQPGPPIISERAVLEKTCLWFWLENDCKKTCYPKWYELRKLLEENWHVLIWLFTSEKPECFWPALMLICPPISFPCGLSFIPSSLAELQQQNSILFPRYFNIYKLGQSKSCYSFLHNIFTVCSLLSILSMPWYRSLIFDIEYVLFRAFLTATAPVPVHTKYWWSSCPIAPTVAPVRENFQQHNW